MTMAPSARFFKRRAMLHIPLLLSAFLTGAAPQTTQTPSVEDVDYVQATTSTDSCTCGYTDADASFLYTDSLIVYFNETVLLGDNIPFVLEDYTNPYEKGWNSLYRQQALPENLQLVNASFAGDSPLDPETALELSCHPSTPNHVVPGAAFRTKRQDIKAGTFRAYVRSPGPYAGSALSMGFSYNQSEALEFSQLPGNEPDDAWISMLSHNQFPEHSAPTGVDYSSLRDEGVVADPWRWMELRIDWTFEEVKFFVNDKLYRHVTRAEEPRLIQTPSALRIKHWSVGNEYSTMGPPPVGTVSKAHVGYVRLFFNSSSMTDEEVTAWDARCLGRPACSVEDWTLRGESSHKDEALLPWAPKEGSYAIRTYPIAMSAISLFLAIVLMLNAGFMRAPWKKWRLFRRGKGVDRMDIERKGSIIERKGSIIERTGSIVGRAGSVISMVAESIKKSNRDSDQTLASVGSKAISIFVNGEEKAEGYEPMTPTGRPGMPPRYKTTDTLVPDYDMAGPSSFAHMSHLDVPSARPYSPTLAPSTRSSIEFNRVEFDTPTLAGTPRGSMEITPVVDDHEISPFSRPGMPPRYKTTETIPMYESGPPSRMNSAASKKSKLMWEEKRSSSRMSNAATLQDDPYSRPPTRMSDLAPIGEIAEEGGKGGKGAVAAKPVKKERIDYLAGLVACSCLLVTAVHFILTFVPAAITQTTNIHYDSEVWARKIISPFLLNLNWIGPFLMTSTRFLIAGYLNDGKLSSVARKTVERPFRMLIPVYLVATLEYFLMDSGAIDWLEYLPSIAWSTWPFATVPTNFGHFLNKLIELGYLIPNGSPAIIFNFCTGVLWTVPVQLQGSWASLLGVIMIREIRSPWKRFGFYFVAIVVNWYALSWASYFYAAIALTDLDLTYDWKPWMRSRGWIYYPLIIFSTCLTFASLAVDMASQWTIVAYPAIEFSLHPDPMTGTPFMDSHGGATYPPYYVPKLNGLLFSIALQTLIELSPGVQKIFSARWLNRIFPHIFTIYLIHGFVFWSVGSALCVKLSSTFPSLPYAGNIAIVAIVTYAVIFISVPILTPIVEGTGMWVTKFVWSSAHSVGKTGKNGNPKRRPTMFPFDRSEIEGREANMERVDEDVDHGLGKEKEKDLARVEEEAGLGLERSGSLRKCPRPTSLRTLTE
jgi:hypothetical protein